MEISDRIYGKVEVQEPVLLELLNSEPVQRLQKIGQFFPDGVKCYPIPTFTRYEHSVGVMLQLKQLGASLEEQAAGLLHDTAHLAFSHISEWSLGSQKNEDYHDRRFSEVIKGEIEEIFCKYKIDKGRILNPDNFSLLEQPSPSICADRVDYALRELAFLHKFYGAPEGKASELVQHLTTLDNRIVFDSKEVAKEFSLYFLRFQTEHWGSPKVVMIYQLLSDAVKEALKSGYLFLSDLEKTDEDVWKKLQDSSSNLPKVRENLKLLTEDFELFEKPAPSYPTYRLWKKFRYVDPAYVENGCLEILSETDLEYAAEIRRHREINQFGISVDIVAKSVMPIPPKKAH